MARFAILNTVDWTACRDLACGHTTEEKAMHRLTGCVWLFRVEARVESVAEAARDAVREHFSSAEGRRHLGTEEELGWEEAMRWVPDPVWARHGLEPLRHPEVERVLLDGEEDLRGELAPSRVR